MPVKEGAAAAIPGSGMRLLSDIPLATATPKQLQQAAVEAIRRVPALAGGKVKWVKGGGALFVTITCANGKTARVRVEFGDTTGGDVANFRRPNERSNDFIVTLSNKAPPEAYARGIAHELGEIRVHGLKQHAGEADVLTAQLLPPERFNSQPTTGAVSQSWKYWRAS